MSDTAEGEKRAEKRRKHKDRMENDPEYRARINGYSAAWRKRNPEKVRESENRRYAEREEVREKRIARQAARFEADPEAVERRRAKARAKYYGQPIDPPRFGACDMCGEVRDGTRGPRDYLVRDHNHDTSVLRGWLCARCNTGLGHLGDNRAGLLRALAYLETHGE